MILVLRQLDAHLIQQQEGLEVLLLRGSTRFTPVFSSHEVKVSGCLQPEASTVRMEAVVLRIMALKGNLRSSDKVI